MNRGRLFEAIIRLSRASKLYPRCFTLAGLEHAKLVTGGSVGDVYTGLLDDQKVAVKMMRVFGDSSIDALLKVYYTKISPPSI
jgi:hypothetical protein